MEVVSEGGEYTNMKKLLVIQPQDTYTNERFNNLRKYIVNSYENNKPIVLPSNVNYEIVELSDIPKMITIQ